MVEMSAGVLDSEAVAGFGALLRQQDKGSAAANAEVANWKESDALSEAERRQQNRAAWFEHYSCLAQTYRKRAEHFERLSEQLLGEDVG